MKALTVALRQYVDAHNETVEREARQTYSRLVADATAVWTRAVESHSEALKIYRQHRHGANVASALKENAAVFPRPFLKTGDGDPDQLWRACVERCWEKADAICNPLVDRVRSDAKLILDTLLRRVNDCIVSTMEKLIRSVRLPRITRALSVVTATIIAWDRPERSLYRPLPGRDMIRDAKIAWTVLHEALTPDMAYISRKHQDARSTLLAELNDQVNVIIHEEGSRLFGDLSRLRDGLENIATFYAEQITLQVAELESPLKIEYIVYGIERAVQQAVALYLNGKAPDLPDDTITVEWLRQLGPDPVAALTEDMSALRIKDEGELYFPARRPTMNRRALTRLYNRPPRFNSHPMVTRRKDHGGGR